MVLEGKRVDGRDFFCTTTFPVGDSFCSLVVGGWGGMVTGISSINGADASENETTGSMEFKNDKWYKVRIRVTEKKIEAWIGDEKVVDVERKAARSRRGSNARSASRSGSAPGTRPERSATSRCGC